MTVARCRHVTEHLVMRSRARASCCRSGLRPRYLCYAWALGLGGLLSDPDMQVFIHPCRILLGYATDCSAGAWRRFRPLFQRTGGNSVVHSHQGLSSHVTKDHAELFTHVHVPVTHQLQVGKPLNLCLRMCECVLRERVGVSVRAGQGCSHVPLATARSLRAAYDSKYKDAYCCCVIDE